MQQGMDWIRSCGGRVVKLHVTTAATEARRLYEAAGFQPDGEQRVSSYIRPEGVAPAQGTPVTATWPASSSTRGASKCRNEREPVRVL
jgi:hypothetical protein